MQTKISTLIDVLGGLAQEFTFAVVPNIDLNPKDLIESVRRSEHFNLVQSFDGYVSEVYE